MNTTSRPHRVPPGSRGRIVAVALTSLALLGAGCGASGSGTSETGQDAAPTGDELTARLDAAVADATGTATAGLLARVDTPTGQHVGTAGPANLRTGRELSGDEAFRIGSVTKLFTAAVALRLVEEGTLDVDEPVATLVPEHTARFEYGDRVTLRQLLGHTSGLPELINERFVSDVSGSAEVDGNVVSTDCRTVEDRDLLGYAADGEAQFEPGESAQYSNTNYVLVGHVVEAATGQPLEELYRERILTPLGMDETWLTCAEQPRAELARGYLPPGLPGPRFPGTGENETVDVTDADRHGWAAGGLVSTGEDLSVFARALFTGELFEDRTTLDTMLEPGEYQLAPGIRYGLGVELDGETFGHPGATMGYTSLLRYYPSQDTVVVTLGNESASPPAPSTYLAESEIRDILGG